MTGPHFRQHSLSLSRAAPPFQELADDVDQHFVAALGGRQVFHFFPFPVLGCGLKALRS